MPVKNIIALNNYAQQPATIATELPELFIAGNPQTRSWPMFSSQDEKVQCGVWESEVFGKYKRHPDSMEYCFILEGQVKVTDQDGQSRIFSAGEGFVVMPGFDGVWECLGKVRKHYVIYHGV